MNVGGGSGGNAHQSRAAVTAPKRFREDDDRTAVARLAEAFTRTLHDDDDLGDGSLFASALRGRAGH